MKKVLSLVITFALIMTLLIGCDSKKDLGSLEFKANGEDFVRQGFVSKDGWDISFEHAYITLSEITAYQTNPPYDSQSGDKIKYDEKVSLKDTKTVDLAEGDENAETISVGKVKAPIGQYNAISWKMVKGTEGEAKDNCLAIIGKATKDGNTIDFNIKVDKQYKYSAGEYIGDERKGILSKDGKADLEMTFHFDHIFGDFDTPENDGLNTGALGFEPLAKVAEDGQLNVSIGELESKLSEEDYNKLIDILPTLGHVGEGHTHAEEI
jgi:hypothetical protein